jgi:hypothetical protein
MSSAASAFIVIPTYWTWPSNEAHRSATAAYDHPTPLDGESTLAPLLEDLASQRAAGFRVLVLVGLAHPDLGQSASARMRALLEPFRARLDLHLCDSAAVHHLYEALQPTALLSELIHLGKYAAIRNLQLLVPHILGAEAVIALDDDERVEPDYMEQSLRYVAQTMDGEKVLGLAGPYLQRDGGVLLSEAPAAGNAFRDKARHINAAVRILTAKGSGLIRSPMALGGNMVIHRELFRRVSFDPGITRGEDIDYLINARLQGIPWWFDPQLTIRHVPPRHLETPAYQRTREDVFRFIYEREKLRLHGEVKPLWLEPYPGALLGSDLESHAITALQPDAAPELVERLGSPEDIIARAHEHAASATSRYPAYATTWQELMARFEQDPSLRQAAAKAFSLL